MYVILMFCNNAEFLPPDFNTFFKIKAAATVPAVVPAVVPSVVSVLLHFFRHHIEKQHSFGQSDIPELHF